MILDLAHQRGVGKTLCPSEVARALGPSWRAQMPDVRRVAAHLANEGRIVVLQSGKIVDPLTAKGPIRIGVPPQTLS